MCSLTDRLHPYARSHWWLRGGLALVISVCVVCSQKVTTPEKTPVSLDISATTFMIYAGGSIQLSAIATFIDGSTDDVTEQTEWSIRPQRAGTVNGTGLFIAVFDSTGVETVRADYEGQMDSVDITVNRRARSLIIWPSDIQISSGESVQLEAIAEFYDGSADIVTQERVTRDAEWSVSPGRAGTVDAGGLFSTAPGMTGLETVNVCFQALAEQSRVHVVEQAEALFEMVTIPAGTFLMGDDNGEDNEKPAHEVYIDAFELGRHEITHQQYVDYLNEALEAGEIVYESGIVSGRKGPYAWLNYCDILSSVQFPVVFIEYVEFATGRFRFQVTPGFGQYPMVRLNWYGAAAFCAHYGYRLPTEAEWEKACRAGLQLAYGTQDGTIGHDLANYAGIGGTDTYYGLALVGSFPPNPYGLYDMAGNAAEYVFDAFDPYYYQYSPANNPTGPGPQLLIGRLPGELAIWRGGSWISASQNCRSAYRGTIHDTAQHVYLDSAFVGFRVARSLE